MSLNELAKIKKDLVIRPHIKIVPDYGEALAISLLLYSDKDPNFSKKLQRVILKITDSYGEVESEHEFSSSIDILIPKNAQLALRRSEWLVERIEEKSLPGYARAASILTQWAKDKPLEEPKSLIIGFIGLAIPFIDLGKARKNKDPMTIIFRGDLNFKAGKDFMHKVTQASHGAIINALNMVGGSMSKLEPEIGDWLFGERRLAFYAADKQKMIAIEQELKNLNVVYDSVYLEDELEVLSVTPSANNFYQELRWQLEPLNE